MGRCHFIFLGTFNASLNEYGLSFCIAISYSQFNKSQIRKSEIVATTPDIAGMLVTLLAHLRVGYGETSMVGPARRRG